VHVRKCGRPLREVPFKGQRTNGTPGPKGTAARRAGQKKGWLGAERGLSQEALAHECGMGRTYLSGVERSERNVSIDNIARIARRLKVEACRLLREG
jgi:hypothetical protein